MRWLFWMVLPVLCFARNTICLNMIVKDEKDVIRRCLDSVKPYIDYWVIVDTGSTDGTQEIVQEHMKDIPGELHERPWKNWGTTRTEALELAQGHAEYILFMDADDILNFDEGTDFGELTDDLYHMWRGVEGFTYLKPQVARSGKKWRWVGVTHEYLDCEGPYTHDTLTNVRYLTLDGGATRKDPQQKFWKNINLLEAGLKEEPNNARYMFYLAESYRDAGESGKALQWYQNRIRKGGWDEEVFWSMLQSALLLKEMGLPSKVVQEAFMAAHYFRPHRPEPIYYLAEFYLEERKYSEAYHLIKKRDYIVQPAEKDTLFNMDWMEDYGLKFQLSICSYYMEQYVESLKVCNELLQNSKLPTEWREQTKLNRKYPIEKLEALIQ